jgi:hypothetical protein
MLETKQHTIRVLWLNLIASVIDSSANIASAYPAHRHRQWMLLLRSILHAVLPEILFAFSFFCLNKDYISVDFCTFC